MAKTREILALLFAALPLAGCAAEPLGALDAPTAHLPRVMLVEEIPGEMAQPFGREDPEEPPSSDDGTGGRGGRGCQGTSVSVGGGCREGERGTP